MPSATVPTAVGPVQQLPGGVVFQERKFPNANYLLLTGDAPTLVDTGFAAHAHTTATWLSRQGVAPQELEWAFNTHWHSDHVGGNALLSQAGAGIIAHASDAEAVATGSPNACEAIRTHQPVPPYTVDRPVHPGDTLYLGQSEWKVIAAPGHTATNLALWEPELRHLVVADTVTSYDVGWVDVMNRGMDAMAEAEHTVRRLAELNPARIFSGHGPLIEDPEAALAKGIERLHRQSQSLDFAVNYGSKRLTAYQLMIRNGMTRTELTDYIRTAPWAADAARMLETDLEAFAEHLPSSMLTSGAVRQDGELIVTTTPTAHSSAEIWDLPWPTEWQVRKD